MTKGRELHMKKKFVSILMLTLALSMVIGGSSLAASESASTYLSNSTSNWSSAIGLSTTATSWGRNGPASPTTVYLSTYCSKGNDSTFTKMDSRGVAPNTDFGSKEYSYGSSSNWKVLLSCTEAAYATGYIEIP